MIFFHRAASKDGNLRLDKSDVDSTASKSPALKMLLKQKYTSNISKMYLKYQKQKY